MATSPTLVALTAAGALGVGLTATTLASDSPEESDPDRDCLGGNPSALTCTEGVDMEEVAQEFLMNQGYDLNALGDCRGIGELRRGRNRRVRWRAGRTLALSGERDGGRGQRLWLPVLQVGRHNRI